MGCFCHWIGNKHSFGVLLVGWRYTFREQFLCRVPKLKNFSLLNPREMSLEQLLLSKFQTNPVYTIEFGWSGEWSKQSPLQIGAQSSFICPLHSPCCYLTRPRISCKVCESCWSRDNSRLLILVNPSQGTLCRGSLSAAPPFLPLVLSLKAFPSRQECDNGGAHTTIALLFSSSDPNSSNQELLPWSLHYCSFRAQACGFLYLN